MWTRLNKARFEKLVLLLVAAAGLVRAWMTRFEANADSIAYLDLSDFYLKHEWWKAVNSYWSPVYAMVAAFARFVAKPSPEGELPLLHFVNFACFLLAILSVRRFLKSLGKVLGPEININPLVVASSYGLLLWAATYCRLLESLTPDILVAVIVIYAGAEILDFIAGETGSKNFFKFGLVLGFGYLVKTAMLPVGIIYITLAGFISPRRLIVAATGFVILVLPQVTLVSAKYGRLTWSESARLNFLWNIDRVSSDFDDKGDAAGNFKNRIYTPVGSTGVLLYPGEGTNPLWLDPMRPYEGLSPVFKPDAQWEQFKEGASRFQTIFVSRLGFLLAVLIAWLFASRRRALSEIKRLWPVTAAALIPILMYGTILVEPRYLGGFVVILLVPLIAAAASAPASQGRDKFAAAMWIALIFTIVLGLEKYDFAVPQSELYWTNRYVQVAAALKQSGLKPGDRVAFIGSEIPGLDRAPWLRIAGAQVVASVPPAALPGFFTSSEARKQVIEKMRQAGVESLVVNLNSVPGEFRRQIVTKGKRLGDFELYYVPLAGNEI